MNRGTVVRLVLHTAGNADPWVVSSTVIGSGFAERTDPAALVVGPTGDAVNAAGTLFVADTADNRIAAIPNAFTRGGTAFTGKDVTSNGWLKRRWTTLAPNGDILTVNAGDGRIVETTPMGAEVASIGSTRAAHRPGAARSSDWSCTHPQRCVLRGRRDQLVRVAPLASPRRRPRALSDPGLPPALARAPRAAPACNTSRMRRRGAD